MLCTLIDNVLPPDYYTPSLIGVRADTQIFKNLVYKRMSKLHEHMNRAGLDVSVVVLKWLMCVYILTLPFEIAARIWDVFLLEGAHVLMGVGLAVLYLHKDELLQVDETAELLTRINDIGTQLYDADQLLKTASSWSCSVGPKDLEKWRKKERQLLEQEYIESLQETEARRRQDEEKRLKEEEEKKRRETEEARKLGEGSLLFKVPRSGSEKQTTVYLVNEKDDPSDPTDCWKIIWDSKTKKKSETTMVCVECSLHPGVSHGIFIKRPKFGKKYEVKAAMCFSVVSNTRSLDLICKSQQEYDDWMAVLQRLPFATKDKDEELDKRRKVLYAQLQAKVKEQEQKRKDDDTKRKKKSNAQDDDEEQSDQRPAARSGGKAKGRNGHSNGDDEEQEQEESAGDRRGSSRPGKKKSKTMMMNGINTM